LTFPPPRASIAAAQQPGHQGKGICRCPRRRPTRAAAAITQICGDPCPLAADTTVTAAFTRTVFTYHACPGHARRLARTLRLLGARTIDVINITTPTSP
jgi:hypothetical protein